jgi:hypothetical protein
VDNVNKSVNNFATKGMRTYMDQDNERAAWQKAMTYRQELIDQLKALGAPNRVENLKQMPIKLLEKMLEGRLKHARKGVKHDGR